MRRPVKADVMPWLARALSSAPRYSLQRSLHSIRAKVRGERDLVQVFVNPRDPFGLPLLQALIQLQERFRVRFRLHTVWQLDDEMYPEPALWRSWAQQDATALAQLYGFTPPDRPTSPSETELTAATARLLDAEKTDDALMTAVRVLEALWRSGSNSPPETETAGYDEARLSANERLLRRLGHYQGSMTRYLGEWFWGVDRLDHLERCLTEQRLNRGASNTVFFTRTWSELTNDAPSVADGLKTTDTVLEVFFSIRSPYSYLGLERAIQLASAWNISLQLRPVLPMLMRGQSVPDTKNGTSFTTPKEKPGNWAFPTDLLPTHSGRELNDVTPCSSTPALLAVKSPTCAPTPVPSMPKGYAQRPTPA